MDFDSLLFKHFMLCDSLCSLESNYSYNYWAKHTSQTKKTWNNNQVWCIPPSENNTYYHSGKTAVLTVAFLQKERKFQVHVEKVACHALGPDI